MLRVVIIEDEKLTSIDLINTLRKIDHDIEVEATLTTIQQAIDFFEADPEFDLIFSDIQLPDGLSFEIFKAVKIKKPIIFCTAFDSYTLEAFDTNGIVYLLKPFNKSSVAKALDKYFLLKDNFKENSNDFNQIAENMEERISPSSSYILIYQGEKIIPVKIEDIALFTIDKKLVYAHTFNQKKLLVTQNLEELEDVCGYQFYRANRQYLLNKNAVKDAERYFNRKILVNLNIPHNNQILIGKLKTTSFLDWLAS